MTGALTFEPIGPEHRETLEAMVQAYYAFDGHTYDPAEQGPALDRIVAGEPNCRAWLIRVDGETVGYLVVTLGFSIEYGGRDGFIDELFLLDAFRGQGLAAEIMAFAERAAAEAGIRYLHLEVELHNERARRVYERTGYETHDRTLMTKKLID